MGVHEIALLPPDQPRAIAVNNCADVLTALQETIDDVFSTLSARIDSVSGRVNDIRQKTLSAQAKIDHLKGLNKATQVFSGAQYPGVTEVQWEQPLYSSGRNKPYQPHHIRNVSKHYCQAQPVQDHVEFFHARDGGEKFDMFGQPHSATTASNPKKGRIADVASTPALPQDLDSVASVLMYDTSYNPYKQKTGKLTRKQGKKEEVIQVSSSSGILLDDAPATLQEGDLAHLLSQDEFQYLPDLTDLPDLDLPADLPALVGIANDLLFDHFPIVSSIAPSSSPASSIGVGQNDSKEVSKASSVNTTSGDLKSNISSDDHSTHKADVTPVVAQKPSVAVTVTPAKNSQTFPSVPPPPPPPAGVETIITPAAGKALSTGGPPPPPPPPPPPADHPTLSTVDDVDQSVNISTQSASVPVSTDSRSELMKAIQAAGGTGKAKLKKVSPDGKARSKSTGAVLTQSGAAGGSSGSGVDLMSDLFAKLSQRRKGISGASKASVESSASGTTMEKMAALIPPPPPPSGGIVDKPSDDGDDDWD